MVIQLVDEVYHNLQFVGTPECQIIWAMVSQKYQHLITSIEWDQINLLWQEPAI